MLGIMIITTQKSTGKGNVLEGTIHVNITHQVEVETAVIQI